MNSDEVTRKASRECGFSLRQEQTRVWRIGKTEAERELTAAEGNLWASVCERIKKRI
jgi:hypothetical protein